MIHLRDGLGKSKIKRADFERPDEEEGDFPEADSKKEEAKDSDTSKIKKIMHGTQEDSGDENLFPEDDEKAPKENDANTIDAFATEVLDGLLSDGVVPTPSNFSLYFERTLDGKDTDFQKQILQILELEEGNDEERRVNFEKSVKSGFTYTKQILQIVATVYKNLNLMQTITQKRAKELEGVNNPAVALSVMRSLEKDVKKLNDIMGKQNSSLKEVYKKSAEIISDIENEAIFDPKYGVYNRKYFMVQIEKEQKSVELFSHQSSLIMAKIPTSTSKTIRSEKGINLVTRTISRLLLKTSRRSDIVCHYGEGIFALLLKHSNLKSAKRAAERLYDMVSATNFFYGEKEYQLDIKMGITNIDGMKSPEECIECALEALKVADYGDAIYEVCKYDIQEDNVSQEDD